MTGTDDQGGGRQPGPVPIAPPSRTGGFSFVWLVPVAALAVALFAAWRNYAERGPLITVSFGNAAGVAVDETELRFRDIAVGLVEGVRFSSTLDRVEVDIRVDPDIAPFVDADARFWVVRPEVTAQGVTGLDTVLSGVYIQGAWDGVPGEEQAIYTGFDTAPLLRAGESGTAFRLESEDSMPTSETPILYKGVQVGRVAPAEIAQGGLSVAAEAVIFEPYDALVTDETRFWDISGFSFSIGAEGAGLDFTSLSSLIAGGVTFETFASGGAPLDDTMVFTLHPDPESAREEFFLEGSGETVSLVAVFEDNVAGLRSGAPVELGGLRVGEVDAISGLVDPERFGDSDARLVVTLRINPSRIGLGDDVGEAGLLDFLDTRVAEGLRARLTNASLLTGGLKIELVELPRAGAATVDRDAEPFPAIPTAPADVANIAASAQGVLARVDALPIEEVLQSVIRLMNDASGLIGSDDTQALPAQISALAGDLAASAARLDRVLADVEDGGGGASIAETLSNLRETTAGLPGLVERTDALIETAQALPLEALVARATALAETADALLADDATRALPGSLNATLETLQATLAEVQALAGAEATRALPGEIAGLTGDLSAVATRLDALLAQADEAGTVAALTDALSAVGEAARGVPALTARADALLGELQGLGLPELVERAEAVLATADGVIGQDSLRALPADLSAALADLRALMGSVQGIADDPALRGLPADVSALAGDLGSTVTRVDALLAQIEEAGTVARLAEAVEDVARAAQSLPVLADQASALLGSASDIPLETLAERASDLLASAEALIDQDSTRAVPATLNGALEELRGTLAELRDGGAVQNVNAALLAARDAADAIAEASATLPALSERLSRTAEQAGATLAGYNENSAFARELQGAIRQIDAAADAIEGLARQLQRNPSSLITGR